MADSAARTVAVLGTGLMGAAIARVLAETGCAVTVWNRTAQKAQVLDELDGITVVDTVADALDSADVAIVSLLTSTNVEAAFAGVDLAGRTVVNLVTGTPGEMAALGEMVTARGGDISPAPLPDTQMTSVRRTAHWSTRGIRQVRAGFRLCRQPIGALTKNLADGVAAGYGDQALAVLAKLPQD